MSRGGPRYAAADVHYPRSGGARAAAVLAASATFAEIIAERTADVAEVAPYQPGQFSLRELPPLRAVLAAAGPLALLVVDGYADLDPAGRPGLGACAHAEFGVPVIGVAKTAFAAATHAVPVLRGASARPLLVTAAGLPVDKAAELVREMAGRFRLPDALRRADALARGAAPRGGTPPSGAGRPAVAGDGGPDAAGDGGPDGRLAGRARHDSAARHARALRDGPPAPQPRHHPRAARWYGCPWPAVPARPAQIGDGQQAGFPAWAPPGSMI